MAHTLSFVTDDGSCSYQCLQIFSLWALDELIHFPLCMWRHPSVHRWICICPFHGSFRPGKLGIKYLPTTQPCTRGSLNSRYLSSALLILGSCSEARGLIETSRASEDPVLWCICNWIPKTSCSAARWSLFLRLFWESFLTPQKCLVYQKGLPYPHIIYSKIENNWNWILIPPTCEGLPGYKAVLANTSFWQETVFFLSLLQKFFSILLGALWFFFKCKWGRSISFKSKLMQIKMGKTCVQFQDKLFGVVSHCRKIRSLILNNYRCVEIFKDTEPFLHGAAR